LLRLSFGLEREAIAVEQAVNQVLEKGYRTGDIADDTSIKLSTTEMVAKIKEALLA
jgi:3-isopropylmalate dehydrogenase